MKYRRTYPSSVHARSPYAPLPEYQIGYPKQKPRNYKELQKQVRYIECMIAPYFLPFLVTLTRTHHRYSFFPRRWLESPTLMGAIHGFYTYGMKTSESAVIHLYTLQRIFEWPAHRIATYLSDIDFTTESAYNEGHVLAINAIQHRSTRIKRYDILFFSMVDNEHYRIADELKQTLTNPVLKKTYRPRDFQIALGW